MSNPRKKPTFIAGSPRSSGDVQTGEVPWTRGGGRVFESTLSGRVADTLLYSGAGRLNTVIRYGPTVSGPSVVFYDGHVATSGGPFATSGHKILYVALNQVGVLSGNVAQIGTPVGLPVQVDMPFQSGLIFGFIGGSGINQWTLSMTPESSQLDEGTSLGA